MTKKRPIREIMSDFFDNSIRFNNIIHIPTQLVLDEKIPSNIRDLFEMSWDQIINALNIKVSDHITLEDLCCDLIGRYKRYGFLGEIAIPVPRDFSDDFSSYTFSFGLTHTAWFYADSIEELSEKALEYQEKYIERKKKEAKESQTSHE